MKKRVFVAIDISDKSRQAAADHIENLKQKFLGGRISWAKAEKLHLTLKFFGEIDGDGLAKLIEAVEKTAREISDFKLQISGTGVFPSPRNARVLWLGVKDEKGSLRKLNEILESQCARQGFPKEKRSFKPHLTLARLKEKSDELVEAHLRENFETAEFAVSEIVIYQSALHPLGSKYSVLLKEKFKQDGQD